MTSAPIVRPIPIRRAILWTPTASAELRMPGYPVFIEQTALEALQEHHRASPAAGLLGFLVGDLCRDPETRVGYVVIDATIRLNQALYGDRTGVVVGKLWDRIQAQLQEIGGQLIGWYHSHPPGGPIPEATDHETHLMYFTQPWQVAIVLAREGAQPVGGVFRPTRDPASVTTSLPFYELVPEAALAGEAAKVSVLAWANYRTDARVVRGPTAAPPRPPARKVGPPPRPSKPTVKPSEPGTIDWKSLADLPPPADRSKGPAPRDDALDIERASDPSSAAPPPAPPAPPRRPPPPPPPEVKKPEPKKPEPKKPEPKEPEPRPSRPTARKAIAGLPLLVDIDEVAEEPPPAPPASPAPPSSAPPEEPVPLLERELDVAFEDAPPTPPPTKRPRPPPHAAEFPFEAPPEPPPEPLSEFVADAEEPAPGRRGRWWPAVVGVLVVLGTLSAAIAVKGFLERHRWTAPAPAPRASQPAPTVGPPAARQPVQAAPPPARPAGPVIAPARTGFIGGGGQRGPVGTRLPQPLVFEVRDTANRPAPGQAVAFSAANATLDPAKGVTDSAGRLRTVVTLGPRVQTVTVTAAVGAIERQVNVTAVPGPAAQIAVTCGGEPVSGRLTLALGAPAVLRLGVEDVGGNALAVTGLRVAVGDDRVLRVAATAASGTAGSVTLQPGREGTTTLAVLASGLRENIAATVARRGSRCR